MAAPMEQSLTASPLTPAQGTGPRRLRQLADLPGPRGWPVFGNSLQIKLARIHRDFERWSRQYGPLFRVRLGRSQVLAIADHELINAVLRERPETFSRNERLREVGKELGGRPGLFSAEGEAWRNQRRMVMASFAPGHIRAYFPSLLGVTLRLQQRWLRAAQAGTAIDLQVDLKRFTLDTIAGLAFGSEVNSLETDDDTIQRHLDTMLAGLFRRAMSPLPYWRVFKLPIDRRLEASNQAIGAMIDGFVARARERMLADPQLFEQPRNLLEAMLAASGKGDVGLSDADVAGNVSTMLFAGEDTTANTLSWLIYLLQRHPDALRRAQQEVRRLAPDPAAFTLEQMGALDYLEACASEAMRLKPVAPFLTLDTLQDTTVADIRVPKGTVIWNVLRGDSLDERHFASANAFEPERWLSDSPAVAAAGSHAKRVAMPFGSGPRMCPGRYLALLEIKLAMAMLLARFEIRSVETPDGGEAEEAMLFTMNPIGLRMRLAERS